MSIRLSSVHYQLSSNLYTVSTLSSRVNEITSGSSLSLSGNLIVGGNLSVTGSLQTPAPYRCTLTLSTTSTLSGSDLVVDWTPVSDPNSWYGSGSKRVTPNVAGWYNVYYQIKFNNATAGVGFQWNIQILRNGVTVAIAQSPMVNDVGTTLVTQTLVYMNGSTDYLTTQVYASNTTVLATATGWSRLELFRLN